MDFDSPICATFENRFEECWLEANGSKKGFDPATLIALVMAVLSAFGICPTNREGALKAFADGHLFARAAFRMQCMLQGVTWSPQLEKAARLMAKKSTVEELDQFTLAAGNLIK